jgi:predicted permease
VWNEWRHDTFHTNIGSIYRLTEKQDQAGTIYSVAVTPGPLAPALKKDFPEIANTVRFGNWSGMVKNGEKNFQENNIQLTDNSIFSVFNFPLVKGNSKTALSSPDEIVISENMAEKYFGKNWATNPALIGQVFRLNDEVDFKLAGIAKNVPALSSIQFDILLPLEYLLTTDEWSNKWNSNNYHTYLQLKPGTDPAAFARKIEHKLSDYNNKTKDILQLQALKAQYLYSDFDFNTDWGKRSNIKYIKIFAGVGLLLLLIAAINFITLSTARSLKRAVEVGIRKVNGASRNQLIRQFLTESVLMAFIAGCFAALLLLFADPLLTKLTGYSIYAGFSGSAFLVFFILFVLLIGVFAGLYPAFIMSGFRPERAIKGTATHSSGKTFGQALVIGQFAVSVILMTCTLFMYRQLRYIQDKDLGFDKEQLLTVSLAGKLREKMPLFKHDLESIPGITGAAPATMSLVNVGNSSYFEWPGMKEADKFLVTQANVDPDFFSTLGIEVVKGKNFSPQKTNDTANFIINQSAVRRLGLSEKQAIGKEIVFWGAKGRVIGVVKDFHFKPLSTAIEPFIFRYQPLDNYFNLFVRLTPGRPAPVIAALEKLYKKYEAVAPFEYSFVSEALDRTYEQEQRTATIIFLFAALTIIVGCLGLFGLTVFAAEQRVKEVGIRKVLGAGIANIVLLLSKDFLKLVLIAIVVAIPVAWYVTSKWLENYSYRISISWWIFAVGAFVVVFMALLTISVQSLKAANANPVESLRND